MLGGLRKRWALCLVLLACLAVSAWSIHGYLGREMRRVPGGQAVNGEPGVPGRQAANGEPGAPGGQAANRQPGASGPGRDGGQEGQNLYGALTLYAQSAVLMDAGSGRVLYEKNGYEVRPMASTTKIMTCILALERGDPDDWVEVSSLAAGQPKVHLGMREGERYRLEDLLYSLMLESHNDTAYAIAEHIGGSVEGFAAMMNQKAGELGCEDTWFITPNGLDAQEQAADGVTRVHSTTAADLARILCYCIGESPGKEEFLKITRTQNHSFTDRDGKRRHGCVNHNAFLSMMEGALTGKTGFTGGAGYSYVGALEQDGRMFVIALLGCGWPPHKSYKWSDSRKLFDYGLAHYQYRDVYREPDLKPIAVEGAVPRSGALWEPVRVGLEVEAPHDGLKLLLGEGEQVEVAQRVPKSLPAPVEKGQEVGAVEYRLHGRVIRRFPVRAVDGVERMGLPWCFRYVWGNALLH